MDTRPKELAVQLATAAVVERLDIYTAILRGEKIAESSMTLAWGDVWREIDEDELYEDVLASLCNIISMICFELGLSSAREGAGRHPLEIWQEIAMLWHDRELD